LYNYYIYDKILTNNKFTKCLLDQKQKNTSPYYADINQIKRNH